ncbi:MAG: HEPN domain-containing protein [Clostridia bacterium]|nr:HEPN domain-containing protein [Clostridia bacterium]
MDFKAAYLAHAEQDLKAATVLYDAGIYGLVLYHCQQAAEKAAKAYLADRGVITGKTHVVSPIMRARLLHGDPVPEVQHLVECVDELEEYVSDVRYPYEVHRGEYKPPDDVYSKGMADEALTMARNVVDAARVAVETD